MNGHTGKQKMRHAKFISASFPRTITGKPLNALNGTIHCNSRFAQEQEELRVQDDERGKGFFSRFPFHFSPRRGDTKHGKSSSHFILHTSLRHAFTLAEVLITLGIIGVVAALTIPTLLQNQQEKATVVSLKKTYSTLSNAYTLAVQENGTPENWNLIGSGNSTGAANMLYALAPYLNTTKNCGTGSGCFPSGIYKTLSGGDNSIYDSDNSYAKIRLSDGSLLGFTVRDQNCSSVRGGTLALSSVCGAIVVDLNGDKKPNQVGVDSFYFIITKYGIIPHGSQQETTFSFNSNCKDKSTASGNGCTAWVLYNENTDYLKCNTLNWSGPYTCD